MLALLALGATRHADAQDTAKVVVTPGAHYDTGWLHEIFFGKHYRELWATPTPVEELDLQRVAGGLTPVQRGGGQQTRSLRFRGGDGREYVVRSLDKDPSALLPPELRGTVANRIVQDQISASHPAGPLVVTPLLEAASIPRTNPRLVRIPPNASLGEFADFAGMVGFFEERPGEGASDPVVPGAVRVISSDNLFERVEESAEDQVDARALLRARLVDVLIGDWDRHRAQWRWATDDSAAPRQWRPIPRDRDQAFVRFDGLLLLIARAQAPQLVNYGPRYPAMVGLTWNGRELDRRFLTGLEWPVWDSTARDVQAAITNDVIEHAVAQLPEAYRPLDSARLASALKGRRDRLPEAARAFYRLLAREVDVHGTDEADLVRITPSGKDAARVTIGRQKGDTTAWFSRVFLGGETGEIRLYLHGGGDSVSAADHVPFTVRIIGGKGGDAVVRDPGARLRIYDADSVSAVPKTRIRRKPLPPAWLPEPPKLPPRDWGSQILPILWSSLAPDVGLLAGGGVLLTDYGFRQQPWASRHLLRAAYATSAETFKVEYVGDFRSEHEGPSFGMHAFASGIEVLRFHGFGNETPATGSNDFYRVRDMDIDVSPTLNIPVGRRGRVWIGPVATWSSTRFTGDRFIDTARPYGSGEFGRLGVQAGIRIDTRDLRGYPRRGVVLDVGGSFRPGLWDVTSTYGEVHGVASTYLSPNVPLSPVLALRAGGQVNFGDYIYQDAAYIGGAANVRLGRERRYAGDASAYASAELRFALTKFFVVLPGEIGLFGLGDVGRVFLEGETSNVWHGAAGGGIWLAFLSRANTMTFAYAASEDRGRIYIQAGWAF
jgi:hypothetical protein